MRESYVYVTVDADKIDDVIKIQAKINISANALALIVFPRFVERKSSI